MSSVGKMTPGPWVCGERCEAGTQPFWTITASSGIAVAKCRVPHRWDETQIEANARAIAALPDLVETLEAIRADLAALVDSDTLDPYELAGGLIDAASAVLAKLDAEGGAA